MRLPRKKKKKLKKWEAKMLGSYFSKVPTIKCSVVWQDFPDGRCEILNQSFSTIGGETAKRDLATS